MIEIKDLNKRYGKKILFQNWNMVVEEHAFAVILGESGCGKTTLLNMIGGLEPFDGGTILVDGIDISQRKNKQEYLSQKVGFLFQNFALVEEYTVSQNLKLIRKKVRSDISMEKALQLVGLSGYEKKKVYQLSGGEQQRIALARLLIKKCDLVLADEPTGSLDKKNAEYVIKLLQEIWKLGKTIVVVTHSEMFMDTATQVIRLNMD